MLKRISIVTLLGILVFASTSCEHQPPVKIGVKPVDTTGGNTSKCSPDTVYFNEILPLITSNCAGSGCHDDTTKADGVQLTDFQNIRTTGEIVPGNPSESKMFKEMAKGDMPPSGKLSQDILDKISKWIAQGAKNNYCNSVCDSTTFKYSADISKIINNNCMSCHASGTTKIGTHSELSVVANNGRLMGAIKHQNGFLPMPSQNTFLSDCEIKKIQKWIDNGTPND
jgi:hypothetical protein